MSPFGSLGRVLIIFGGCLVLAGLLILVAPRIPWIGRLPGDIIVRKKNFTFYFPLATSIVLSVLLTVLFNLFRR
jgi:hypothetical protein